MSRAGEWLLNGATMFVAPCAVARLGLLGAILGLALWACGGEEPDLPPLRIALPDSAILTSFGRLDAEDGVGVFSMISEATLSESGLLLAVGDFAPPYVHILDRTTGASWAFGRRGEGPGEFLQVNSIQFVGDSLIQLLSTSRLEESTPSGQWLHGWPLADAGLLRAGALTRACNGDLLYYGSAAAEQSGDSAAWLFRGTRPGEPTRPIAFQPAPVASPGGPFRFAQGSQLGAAVLHPQDGVEVLHWIPCDGIPTALWRERFSVSGRPAESSSGRKGMGYTLPDTMFWGLGVEGDTVVYALTWKDGDDRITSLNLAAVGECRSVELFGSWMLYGLDRGLMLLARQDPYPAVEVVSWDWIRAHLRAARCRAVQ